MTQIPRKENTDTRASLELLYHVSREIATAVDLQTLIQRILYLSIKNIGAVNGSIIAVDDGGSPVASSLMIGEEILDFTNEQIQATLDQGLAGWVVQNRQAVLIRDTSKDRRWLQRPDDAEDATGAKSVVSSPFLAQDRLAGIITLVHPEPNYFNDDHQNLVQAIADQSAVAILNSRLHTESLRQARIMTALAESARIITGSLNLSDVLQRILEQISQAIVTEAVSLAMLNQKEGSLEFIASTSNLEHNVAGKKIKIGQGIAGWVAKEKKSVIIPDVYKDERFYTEFDKETGFKTNAIACTPILSQGEVIGVVEAINPKGGAFGPDTLEVLTGISNLAGTAIQHAQLYEALQSAHKRYHHLFEGSINSILISDWAGKIQEANQQTTVLTQFTKEELYLSNIGMIHRIDLELLGNNYQNVSEDSVLAYESTLNTKNGDEIPITVLVQAVNIDAKSYIQWVIRDDTDRVELDQLKDDLLSMIYHDLRSPLANVVSSLDVLKTMVETAEEPIVIKSLFDIAIRSTQRIQRLINSLLDINRLEAGQIALDLKPVSLEKLVQESVDTLKPIIENRKLKVSIEIPPKLPRGMIDDDMIRRVIINLVENAIKYSPIEGFVNIHAAQSNDFLHIRVQDNGPGIPQEKRDEIFNKYTRLQGKVGYKGYGLGLAYCRLAIEGHGGEIWVADAPEGGSIFNFTIPVAP
jgi:NtrC-family two-component system sensor histidine kinase KinB